MQVSLSGYIWGYVGIVRDPLQHSLSTAPRRLFLESFRLQDLQVVILLVVSREYEP